MKIKHLTPAPYTTHLENLSRGQVFRFKNSNSPYMALSYSGDEIKAVYKHRHGGIEELLGDIEIIDANLYIWSDNDETELKADEYLHQNEDEELIAYLDLASGRVFLSHRREVVIPLEAELTVSDMRSPD